MPLATPAPLSNATTGWRVDCVVSGGTAIAGEQLFGTVRFVRTGHSELTTAGFNAILTQYATYLNGLGAGYVLTKHTEATVGLFGGSYSVQNTDLGAQQAIIFGLLVNANVSGPA